MVESAQENGSLYRQQFNIGPYYAQNFSSWQKNEISESLFVISHPDLTITQLSKDKKSLTLIGYMIDPNE